MLETRLDQDRVEDIDRVGAHRSAGKLDDRLVVVILVLDPGQQGVIETACREMPGEVELGVLIRSLQLAVVEIAAQGASVGRDTIGLNVVGQLTGGLVVIFVKVESVPFRF